MVPSQTKGRRFLPWRDRREVVNFPLFETRRERLEHSNLIPKKEIFQYTEQLKEAIRSKNQSIIGSGLWSLFTSIQSGKR